MTIKILTGFKEYSDVIFHKLPYQVLPVLPDDQRYSSGRFCAVLGPILGCRGCLRGRGVSQLAGSR